MVTLTKAAADEIKTLMREQKLPADRFLRVAVAAGPKRRYTLGFGHEFDPATDVESTSFGVRVVVSRASAKDLQGMTIDYEAMPVPGFRFKKGG